MYEELIQAVTGKSPEELSPTVNRWQVHTIPMTSAFSYKLYNQLFDENMLFDLNFDDDVIADKYVQKIEQYVNLPDDNPRKIYKFTVDKLNHRIILKVKKCEINNNSCCCICWNEPACNMSQKSAHGICNNFQGL